MPLYAIGVDLFHFARIYLDGRRFSLSNKPYFTQYMYEFYSIHYQLTDFTYVKQVERVSSRYMDFTKESNTVANYAQSNFGLLYDGFLLVKRSDIFTDYLYFSANEYRAITQHLGVQEVFEHFYLYFLDKGSGLIASGQQCAVIPQHVLSYAGNEFKDDDSQLARFFQYTPIDRFYLENSEYLTKREIHCLGLLANGLDYQGIANHLSRSVRTVINHFENIKRKTGCEQLISLVVFATKNNFHRLYVAKSFK
jgi:DNA-binding CsgD family transcriptional regulator